MNNHVMRAKMKCGRVESTGQEGDAYRSERLFFHAIAKNGAYPADGSDEDNSFARWTPSADLSITITNPSLFGQVKEGDIFYLDFTRVPAKPAATP